MSETITDYVEAARQVVVEFRRKAMEWVAEHPYPGYYAPEYIQPLRDAWERRKAGLGPIEGNTPEATEAELTVALWGEAEVRLKTPEELAQAKRERNAAIADVMSKLSGADNGIDDVVRQGQIERAAQMATWMLKANGPFVPANEMETIFLFVSVMGRIDWEMVALKPNQYPDGVIRVNDQIYLVEFEHTASNFIAHGHDARGADLVICWHKDKVLTIPCVALKESFDSESKQWDMPNLQAALSAAIRMANVNYAAMLDA